MSEIRFNLSTQERDLVLKELGDLDVSIRRKLSLCEQQGKRLVVLLTVAEAREVSAQLSSSLSSQPRKIRRKLDRINEKLLSQLPYDPTPVFMNPSDNDLLQDPVQDPVFDNDEDIVQDPMYDINHDPELDPIDLTKPLPSWASCGDFVVQRVMDAKPESEKKARILFEQALQEYDTFPQELLGGLSALQFDRLLYSDYKSPESPIQFNRDLPLSELEGSEYLINARTFLKLLVEEDGTKATQAENLNRKFVKLALDQMHFPDQYLENVYATNRVINEADANRLHIIRILLDLSDMIRIRKRRFVVTGKGKKFLKPENAGGLYSELFYSFLKEFNHAYLDWFKPDLSPQLGYSYSLYHLHLKQGNWIEWKDMINILPYFVLDECVKVNIPFLRDLMPFSIIKSRIVYQLMRFGLLEIKEGPSEIHPSLNDIICVRTTPLFDKFLEFNID